MASNQPTTGREVLAAGIDVRKIRKPINDAFASVPIELIGQGAATSTDGRRMSFTVIPEDTFYIRLNNKTTVNGTIRYAWTAVNQDRDTGNWTNCVRSGNATTDDWATELNNTDLTVGTATRYLARVNPQSGRVTFFFRNRNLSPLWPVGLWGFHGILEFGYFDQYDAETETLSINPAVVDKDEIANIQDFRLKNFTTGETPGRFRGASGWFFQANASTATVRINTTTQDERDIGPHEGWEDIVEAWEDGDIGSYDSLFLGIPTFGGYYYGTVDEDVSTTHEAGPGPIRMTYLYGDTFTTLNNRLQFEWQGSNQAKLVGTTPAIPNWAESGSLVPDDPDSIADIVQGADTIIPIDGLRGIRLRVLGWHAHMADHACKPSDTFTGGTFPAGMQFVWRENAAPFGFDEGDPIGDYTPQSSIDPVTSEIIYNDKIEFTGFHHFYFGQWSDAATSGPPRYQLDLKTKVWYKDESDPAGFRPDPFKVLVGDERHEADEVIHTDAAQRQTVHLEPDPVFNVEASFANNVGFVIDFSQTVDNIAWIHQEWRQDGKIAGVQFWGGQTAPVDGTFGVTEGTHNTIAFTKTNALDRTCDNMDAALIAVNFGTVADTPMPKAFVAAKSFANSLSPAVFRVIRVWDFPAGTTYDVEFSDETLLTDVEPLEFEHDIDRPFWADVTARPPDADPVTHRTWFEEAGESYQEFCQILDDSSAAWSQFGSLLVVKINGSEVTSSNEGEFVGGVTISFEFSPALTRYLEDNPDVELTYEWGTVCSGVPKNPVTGSGDVTDLGTVSVPYTDTCGGDNRVCEFFRITMTTPTLRALFDAECEPYDQNQGITRREASFSFEMSQP